MKTTLRYFILIACTTLLTSCWVPEQFTATLNVDKNLNYDFHYEGHLAFVPALGEIAQRGSLSPQGEAEMKKGEAALRNEAGFQKVDYLGNGRFDIIYAAKGVVQDQKELFLGLVRFSRTPEGALVIRGATINDDARRQLSAVHADFDGKLKITTELPVLQHNATAEPMLAGLIGSYAWQVNLVQKSTPFIALGGAFPAQPQVVQQPAYIQPANRPAVQAVSLAGERYPQTRVRLLTAEEAQSWSYPQLRYAINEMYARHGLYFKDDTLRNQFIRLPWYHANPTLTIEAIEAQFSQIETQNIHLLGELRNARRH